MKIHEYYCDICGAYLGQTVDDHKSPFQEYTLPMHNKKGEIEMREHVLLCPACQIRIKGFIEAMKAENKD